jgi:hypothetical protein
LKEECKRCKESMSLEELTANLRCFEKLAAGRAEWLDNGCDYIMEGSIAKGSEKAERGHRQALEAARNAAKKCAEHIAGSAGK